MQIQKIQNDTTFVNIKGTFLQKSKNALTREMKSYYMSLHHEAKSRLYHNKYEKKDLN